MAEKGKVKEIDIKLKHGAFSTFFRRFTVDGRVYGGLDFTDITALRQLLSNEKARILHTIQDSKPKSVYELAKRLGRDFKSVRKDIELLKQFELIRLEAESKGKRRSLKPVLNFSRLQINLIL